MVVGFFFLFTSTAFRESGEFIIICENRVHILIINQIYIYKKGSAGLNKKMNMAPKKNSFTNSAIFKKKKSFFSVKF